MFSLFFKFMTRPEKSRGLSTLKLILNDPQSIYFFTKMYRQLFIYKIVNRLRETIAIVFFIFAYPFN